MKIPKVLLKSSVIIWSLVLFVLFVIASAVTISVGTNTKSTFGTVASSLRPAGGTTEPASPAIQQPAPPSPDKTGTKSISETVATTQPAPQAIKQPAPSAPGNRSK